MSEYRLGALLRLRWSSMEDAWRGLRVSVASVREAAREYRKIAVEAELRRTRATEPYPNGEGRTILCSVQAREQWRKMVETIRRRLETQRDCLHLAEAKEREAVRALVEARAAREALEDHRRRWLEARRAEQESAEEREVDDWLSGRYTGSWEKASPVNGSATLEPERIGASP